MAAIIIINDRPTPPLFFLTLQHAATAHDTRLKTLAAVYGAGAAARASMEKQILTR